MNKQINTSHTKLNKKIKQEVNVMCNLSQYVKEQGIKQGIELGEKKIITLYNWLKESNRIKDANAVLEEKNKELRAKLYAEFDKANK